ncbi:hypothetical protein BD410DRAFT_317619 [Rickenella mellea]|uniref:Uncharacterized protein n=1 Tax=Rickenella mellea TaxID=50990 RepID=A0A4Y7PH36_9AGAM|nr:hypothetical protein BD410DRAFT_317619 [Rickenella mellea]
MHHLTGPTMSAKPIIKVPREPVRWTVCEKFLRITGGLGNANGQLFFRKTDEDEISRKNTRTYRRRGMLAHIARKRSQVFDGRNWDQRPSPIMSLL